VNPIHADIDHTAFRAWRYTLFYFTFGLPLHSPSVSLLPALSLADFDEVQLIFREYAQSLAVDLSFQNFEQELQGLPGDYAPPRGALILAHVDGCIAGCCALRPLDNCDHSNAAEMKRLYVRPAYRGLGLGRQLTEAILDTAHRCGYACVLLDTLDDMEAARALYEDLGFEEVPPFYHNPYAGAHYLKAVIA
jgi:putative acetyltransferase